MLPDVVKAKSVDWDPCPTWHLERKVELKFMILNPHVERHHKNKRVNILKPGGGYDQTRELSSPKSFVDQYGFLLSCIYSSHIP